ncbi:MAG: hypothetical protein KC435_05015 [Thermomicrobiales bacterium]|nr:hypothetical protein [Thermomicrobiales bacterium]
MVDLGVLFVHGMGSQSAGDMLAEYMNPALEWMKRVVSDDHHSYHANDFDQNLLEGVHILVRKRGIRLGEEAANQDDSWVDITSIGQGLLQSTSTLPDTFQPPFVDVTLRRSVYRANSSGDESATHDDCQPKRMLAVEAWWSKEFDAPGFKEVAAWGLGMLPTLILRHIALMWEQGNVKDAADFRLDYTEVQPPATPADVSGASIFQIARRIVATPLIGLVAIVAQWLVCLLMIWSPIPFLRKYIAKLILWLTSSLGDVLVYVHDGVKSAAIRTTVLRAAQWLYTHYKVKRLMVVAHSLGTVVTYDILSTRDLKPNYPESDKDKGVTFVTFGSPLKKVNVILDLNRDEQRISLGMLFATLSFFGAIMALIVRTNEEWFPKDNATPWVWAEHRRLLLWIIAVAATFGVYLVGIGAHAKPTKRFSLSRWELLGIGCIVASCIAAMLIVSSSLSHIGQITELMTIAFSGAIVIRCADIASETRREYGHRPDRMSLTLAVGFAMIVLMTLLASLGMMPLWATFLVISIIFSVLSASNPLEEFKRVGDTYERQLPRFMFSTPIKRWVDFWGTKDPVPEFGLRNMSYQVGKNGPIGKVNSRQVTNQSSVFLDHTTYKRNTEQFVAPLTRMFLEELGYSEELTPSTGVNNRWSWLGITRWEPLPIDVNENSENSVPPHVARRQQYANNIANVMHSRAPRFRLLNGFSALLLASFLLLSPSIARSIGEFIVYSTPEIGAEAASTPPETNAHDALVDTDTSPSAVVACVVNGEERDAGANEVCAPKWFTAFYNQEPISCTKPCVVRTPPLVPADMVHRVMDNSVMSSITVHTLGYLVLFGIASLLRIAFLQTPWRSWELGLLDRVTQTNAVTGDVATFGWLSGWTSFRKKIGLNSVIRGLVFGAACAGVILIFAAFHGLFGDTKFLASAQLGPWWTLQTWCHGIWSIGHHGYPSNAAADMARVVQNFLPDQLKP